MKTVTHTEHAPCKHLNGWWVPVRFWIFQSRDLFKDHGAPEQTCGCYDG